MIGCLVSWFVSKDHVWERAIATDPKGWPWEFTSEIIDPTGEANQESCGQWYRAQQNGWRWGLCRGSFLMARHRSPMPLTRQFRFDNFGFRLARDAGFGPYFYRNGIHFSATCKAWNPDWIPYVDTAAGSMLIQVNTTIVFPAWAPVPFMAIFPVYWVLWGPQRTLRRRRKGLCTECAYNLAGNVSGVCPECGMAIAPLKPKEK